MDAAEGEPACLHAWMNWAVPIAVSHPPHFPLPAPEPGSSEVRSNTDAVNTCLTCSHSFFIAKTAEGTPSLWSSENPVLQEGGGRGCVAPVPITAAMSEPGFWIPSPMFCFVVWFPHQRPPNHLPGIWGRLRSFSESSSPSCLEFIKYPSLTSCVDSQGSLIASLRGVFYFPHLMDVETDRRRGHSDWLG